MAVKDSHMIIQLNGQPHGIGSEISVLELLESLGLGGKPVVVELNEEAVFPRDYANARIAAGARVEIVTLAAGG